MPLLIKLLKEFRGGDKRTSSVRGFQEFIVDGRNNFDKRCVLQEMFRRLEALRRLYVVTRPRWLGIRLQRYLWARK